MWFIYLVFLSWVENALGEKGNFSMADTLFMSKKKANEFSVYKRRGPWGGGKREQEAVRERGEEDAEEAHSELKEECCGEQCSNGEIDDKVYAVGRPGTLYLACEVSLREDNGYCRCKDDGKRCGVKPYMAGYGGSCSHPCIRGKQFLCDKARWAYEDGKSCIPNAKRCDTYKDCKKNANDEAGCKIMPYLSEDKIKETAALLPKKSSLFVVPAAIFGVAHIDNRIICKKVKKGNNVEGISKKTATVFCRTMKGNGPRTVGMPLPVEARVLYPQTSTHIMSNANCAGSERHIGLCPHQTSMSECSGTDGAAIGCFDPSKLKLILGSTKYDGRLPFIQAANDNAAKAICSTIFNKDFNRANKDVPLFRRLVSPPPYSKKYAFFRITCAKGVTDVTQCDIIPHYALMESVLIYCAKCNADNLIGIVNSITNTGTTRSVVESLQAANRDLKSQCNDWKDCLEENHEYEEFCLVKRFIDDALYTLKPVPKGNQNVIRENIDYQKLIELNSLQLQFSEQTGAILNLGKTLGVSIGHYFENLANFDEKLATADVEYSKGVWKNAKKNIEKMHPEMETLISDIIKAAIVTAEREETIQGWKTFFLGGSIAQNLINFDFSFVSGLIDGINDMKTATRNVKALEGLPQLFEGMKSQVIKIKEDYGRNKATFDQVDYLLVTQKSDALYVNKVKLFLEAYKDFSPAITNSGMAQYVSAVERMLSKCCEIIENGGGSAATKQVVKNSCPKVTQKFEVAKAFYEDLGEHQIEIMDSFARVARSQIAKKGAEQLKHSVSHLRVKVKEDILKKNIKIVLRAHKMFYIESFCKSTSYRNYGKVDSDCTYLMNNPDASAVNLIAKTVPLMCGHSRYTNDKIGNIPVSDTKVGAFLNISALYALDPNGHTNGYATFKIPSAQWLFDNQWIPSNNAGPFALKSIKLHLPPGTGSEKSTYDLRIKITGSKVGSKSYTFIREVRDTAVEGGVKLEDGTIIANTYIINPDDECAQKNLVKSHYNVRQCKSTIKDVCWSSGNHIKADALHLPMLVGSTWEITLTSNTALKPLLMSQGNLKAEVTICSEKVFPRSRRRRHAKRTICCSPTQVYDEAMRSCKDCPSGEQPFLWDRYCARCPPGYETSTDAYGCKKCSGNKLKESAGPGQCK